MHLYQDYGLRQKDDIGITTFAHIVKMPARLIKTDYV